MAWPVARQIITTPVVTVHGIRRLSCAAQRKLDTVPGCLTGVGVSDDPAPDGHGTGSLLQTAWDGSLALFRAKQSGTEDDGTPRRRLPQGEHRRYTVSKGALASTPDRGAIAATTIIYRPSGNGIKRDYLRLVGWV